MPVERINRYKKTARLGFCNEQTEESFQKFQSRRGRSTSIYALTALTVLNLSFAFLEYWILGLNSMIPLIAYLAIAGLSAAGVIFSLFSQSTSALMLRILVPGGLTFAVLLSAVFLQQYRIYHAIEIALLVIWMGSLNILNFRLAVILSVGSIAVFSMVAFLFGASDLKLTGLLVLEVAAFSLAIYLSYMLERFRRMMFLTNTALQDVYSRQESWAYSLIDLDMALSGIRDFNELITRLMEFIKPVIAHDSFVWTSLEGKGSKPSADQVDGTLFEQEDQTLWPEDLLTKLSQTRQATTSAQYEMVKGFLGSKRKNFLYYSLDIPVFNNSTMVGVISLRRQSEAFDDLDMTASVSMAAQAMIFFNRTHKAQQVSGSLQQQVSNGARKAVIPRAVKPKPADKLLPPNKTPVNSRTIKDDSPTIHDLDLTEDPTISKNSEVKTGSKGRDETVVPQAVIEKIKKESASAKKTITLLSRENADQIAVDRYRTAAVEGEPLSVLLIEVDGLTSIREKDGDQTAYRVFAGIVKNIFKKTDIKRDVLGRYGQNGLSVLLPRVDMNAAEKFAESIRQYAERTQFKTSYGERSATLSIGVAAITDETGNYDSMVKRADMALFVAKKNGRNCVKVRL